MSISEDNLFFIQDNDLFLPKNSFWDSNYEFCTPTKFNFSTNFSSEGTNGHSENQ